MSHEVNVLEELLARVQRNAALPRLAVTSAPAAALSAPPAPASAPHASAPLFEVPGSFVEPPLDSSPEFESEPMFEAPAPVPYDSAFESDHPPVAAHVTSLDQSVDEMLLADPFPSMPPAPVAQQSLTDMLDEDEPIPLVSVSPHSIAQEDISAVMNRSDLSHEVPEELLEDDIVEMSPSEGQPAPAASNHDLSDLNFDDEDTDHNRELSEPPASSSRHKVAGSMDEALARAAEQIELQEGREVPLKTPPPESGPQAAMALPAGVHAPLAPDIEELLEADIMPVGGVNAAVPTAEQLGQTIDLEEARGPHLELDSAEAAQPAPLQEELPNEELEVTLPRREFGGGYQADLMPPPEARQDLDAHRDRFGEAEHEAPPPESLAQYPSQPPPESGFAPVIVPAGVSTDSHSDSVSTVTVDAPPSAEFAPELLMRPEQSPSPVAKFIRVQAPRPNTFLELLDASLGLGRNY